MRWLFIAAALVIVAPALAEEYKSQGTAVGVIVEIDREGEMIAFEDGSLYLYDDGIIFKGGLTMDGIVLGARLAINWEKDTADLIVVSAWPAI